MPDKSSEPKVIEALLKAIIEVLSEREVDGKNISEIRYYFSSCKVTAKEFAEWIRGHWSMRECYTLPLL